MVARRPTRGLGGWNGRFRPPRIGPPELLVPRYLLLLVPGVALLVAVAATEVRWSAIATVLVAVAVSVNAGVVLARSAEYRLENWRDAQALVAAQAQPGDGIVFAPTQKGVSFEYYQLHEATPTPKPSSHREHGVTFPTPGIPSNEMSQRT